MTTGWQSITHRGRNTVLNWDPASWRINPEAISWRADIWLRWYTIGNKCIISLITIPCKHTHHLEQKESWSMLRNTWSNIWSLKNCPISLKILQLSDFTLPHCLTNHDAVIYRKLSYMAMAEPRLWATVKTMTIGTDMLNPRTILGNSFKYLLKSVVSHKYRACFKLLSLPFKRSPNP